MKIGEEIKTRNQWRKANQQSSEQGMAKHPSASALSVSFWSIDCTGWQNKEYKSCVVDENFHESTVYEIYKCILKNW